MPFCDAVNAICGYPFAAYAVKPDVRVTALPDAAVAAAAHDLLEVDCPCPGPGVTGSCCQEAEIPSQEFTCTNENSLFRGPVAVFLLGDNIRSEPGHMGSAEAILRRPQLNR